MMIGAWSFQVGPCNLDRLPKRWLDGYSIVRLIAFV